MPAISLRDNTAAESCRSARACHGGRLDSAAAPTTGREETVGRELPLRTDRQAAELPTAWMDRAGGLGRNNGNAAETARGMTVALPWSPFTYPRGSTLQISGCQVCGPTMPSTVRPQ